MKKTPKIIEDEMKYHNMMVCMVALMDYNTFNRPANEVVKWMKSQREKRDSAQCPHKQ
jgi:hypothetical protein